MDKNETQRIFWEGKFGTEYAVRNNSLDSTNKIYKERTGFTHEEIFTDFFRGLDKNIKILELGCNIGLKLTLLHNMGFDNLYGVEINETAYNIAKKNNPYANIVNSSIEEFPSNKNKFDMVFVSGVLIHIHPNAINDIIKKILELSKKYVFGFDYFSNELVEINYRGNSNVLWKQNFPKLFQKNSPNLKIIKQQKIYWKNENLCDIAYLLEKVDE
jgi:pseudaminic acid biosynthesis-associated methylase